MVRFLHAADLHLGSPLEAVASRSETLRDQLHGATYDALQALVDGALDQDVDFVVWAGDIYDQESRSVKANHAFVEQLKRLDEAGIPSYIIYGNHDPLGSASELFDLPDSAHVFGADDVGVAYWPDEDAPEVCILGQSYKRPAESRKMYSYYTPPRSDVPAIGVLHSGLDPDSGRYVPCSLTDLQGKDEIDYWALGHIHQTRVFEGTPKAAFPGIPQGRHVNELGVGGAFLVEMEQGGDPELSFLPAGPIVWDHRELSIGDPVGSGDGEPPETMDDLLDALSDDAQDLLDTAVTDLPLAGSDIDIPVLDTDWEPQGYVVRWTIGGRGKVHTALEDQEEAASYLAAQLRRDFGPGAPFLWTEAVRVRTAHTLPDIETVLEKDPVLQEFVGIVEEVREDEEAREALRERCKNIWYDPQDPENVRLDQFPLEDEDIDRFLEDAKDLIVDRILEEREARATT